MCLLVVLSRTHAEFPLVVAANRDELYDRPAVPMTVLQTTGPRILGGRDEQGGGTWLAVNETGVFAGLTNRPTTEGRDPTKKSRGELPLALARHVSASEAVKWFVSNVRPAEYNPSWILVGDRRDLFAIDNAGGPVPEATALAPGVHILENRPPGAPSPKVERVRELVGDVNHVSADVLEQHLEEVLRDHEVPEPAAQDEPSRACAGEFVRPAATEAACVHTDRYGTRWAGMVLVPAGQAFPRVRYSPGPSCTTDFVDADALWRKPASASGER